MTQLDNKKPLLSITIPTFNRAKYLDLCLSKICDQTSKIKVKELVEVIVSDNCSTDNTEEIVNKFQMDGNDILYFKNEKNLGFDGNFERCFSLAKGKYLWIFSDDDILLDSSLDLIISLISGENYGNLYLNHYWYKKDYEKEKPIQKIEKQFTIFNNRNAFVQKVNYKVTFITGNIINKSILPESFYVGEFIGTNLNQISWYLTASSLSKNNIYIDKLLLACKTDNSGGYSLYEVFAKNFNYILKSLHSRNIVTESNIEFINNKMILEFFPGFIHKSKNDKNTKFDGDGICRILKQIYKDKALFWMYLVPIIKLPLFFSKVYSYIVLKVCLYYFKVSTIND